MRGVVAAVLVGALLGAGTAGRADDQPRALDGFAVLGLEGVTLRAGAAVESGNVGATRGTVTLGRRAAVAGTVLADTIELAGPNRVGPLYCRLVQGPVRFGCATLTDPVANLARLNFVQVSPGAADVDVPRRASTAPLAAGAYGAVTVGTRARLLLAGGSYELLSLDVAHRGRLLCAKTCRNRIRERATLGRRSIVGVAPPLDARALEMDFESRGPRPVFVSRPDATVSGTIYAPNGDLVLGSRGRYEGAFIGQTVTIGRRSRVKLLSAL